MLTELAQNIEKQIESLDQQTETEREKSFLQLRLEVIEKNIHRLSAEDQKIIHHDFLAFGPLTDLIDDNSVTEIIIQGADQIWIEKGGRLTRLQRSFLTQKNYQRCVDRIALEAKCSATLNTPFADGKWKNFRLHLIRPPLCSQYASLTLRNHPEEEWTLERLKKSNWCQSHDFSHIQEIIRKRKNFLVVGPTGSGKTSTLNALLHEARHDRCLLLEDCEELHIPENSPSNRLMTRFDAQGSLAEITLQDLLKQSLRMRPDRIVIGELRGGEAKDYLLALSTGHAGSFGTLHAECANQALMRLEMLIQMGAPQWSLETIRRLIHLSIHYIIVVKKDSEGRRILQGLYQIQSLERHGFTIQNLSS